MSSRIRFKVVRSVILGACVVGATLATSVLIPTPRAQAVTYSQLVGARQQAQQNKQNLIQLEQSLGGVNAQLKDKLLELNNLVNSQIPQAQNALTQTRSQANSLQEQAQTTAGRLAAARADKQIVEKRIQESGANYNASKAALAEVARQNMRGSNAGNVMAVFTNASSAQGLQNSMQVRHTIARYEAGTANDSAEIMTASMTEGQRLDAIEKRISVLAQREAEQAARAQQQAQVAEAKTAELKNLYEQGNAQATAFQSELNQLKSQKAREAAKSLILQAQITAMNAQYMQQQAEAQRNAARNAIRQQGTLGPVRPSHAGAPVAPVSPVAPVAPVAPPVSTPSTGVLHHPSGDVGNAYPFSQCTWWCYIRRHQLGLPCASYFGNGCQWAASARRLGYVVNNTPSVGAIAVFQPGQDGAVYPYGHVAIVEAINPDGSITISECNAWNNGRIDTRRIYNPGRLQFIHN